MMFGFKTRGPFVRTKDDSVHIMRKDAAKNDMPVIKRGEIVACVSFSVHLDTIRPLYDYK